MKNVVITLITAFLLLGSAGFAAGPAPKDPIYIATNTGYKGFYPHNEQYAEFSLPDKEVKIQDAYHILLRPKLGLMLTFVDKKEFGDTQDLLASHAQWELDYWRKNADRVESGDRDDLRGSRKDLKVTEMTLTKQGKANHVYLVGLASKNGVFVFSISPIDKNMDPLVREIIGSIKLANKTLDVDELKTLSAAEKKK